MDLRCRYEHRLARSPPPDSRAQYVKIRRLMGEDGKRVTVNELVDAARRRLRRLDPNEARDAVVDGAVLVDIRSELQRERDGVIPGARFVPRNALEWRLDPASGHSDPTLDADLDRVVVLVCNEGYQSSLAAATLQDLGFRNATDLAGGFQAWRAAGLSVVSQPPR